MYDIKFCFFFSIFLVKLIKFYFKALELDEINNEHYEKKGEQVKIKKITKF